MSWSISVPSPPPMPYSGKSSFVIFEKASGSAAHSVGFTS